MIVSQWQQFRWHFAVKGVGAPTATFTAPHTITHATAGWLASGVLAGHDIDFAGTASNNKRYRVEVATAANLTVTETVVAEGPIACTFVSAFHDVDGLETWPYALMRAGGIGNITGVPTPYALGAFIATINAEAADAAPGVDEYDWYLSRRTDDPAKQLLSMAQKPPSGGNTYSGSVVIAHSALSITELDLWLLPTFTPEKVPELFKYCHLYVQRKADKAMQWIDLLRAMTT